jgi:dynein intermediate chain 1
VHIYDLYINKYSPVCIQAVVPKKKARLNHISFNQTHPIIIVGDSRGFIQCLKLSPNLRRQSKEVKTALVNKDLKKAGEMEIKKLDQLLSQVGDRGWEWF